MVIASILLGIVAVLLLILHGVLFEKGREEEREKQRKLIEEHREWLRENHGF